MRAFHSICALLLLLAAPFSATAQENRSYLVFLGGTPVGREDLTVRTDPGGTTLTARNSIGAPVNLTTRRVEIRYRPDWTPESAVIDASQAGVDLSVRSTFANGSVSSEGTEAGRPVPATQTVAGRTFVLPNVSFTAHEALGRWLVSAPDSASELRAFVTPGFDVLFRVVGSGTTRMQTGTTTFTARTFELRFANTTGELSLTLVTTENGSLVRLTAPAQGLDVVRDDLATATARTNIYSNPGDEQVMIPAAGFNLGATITRPKTAAPPAGFPTVILLAGSGANDRDGTAAGVPILGQLAGALADAGFLVVRYDKRGYGQSGGRSESATISDYADDARGVFNWLRRRNDVDEDRVGLVGHSEGAWVALLTASRERRIAAVAAIAAPAATGAELVLEQQQHALEQANAPAAEREQKVALQKQIQTAVLTGTGWEGVPPALRRQADTPWFQSLLAFNPATVVDDVRQPMLFVHGQLDRQVPVSHLDRLSDLARKMSRSKSVEVITVRGINHLLVPATTGEVAEYSTLTDRNISPDVTMGIASWLTKTFAAIK